MSLSFALWDANSSEACWIACSAESKGERSRVLDRLLRGKQRDRHELKMATAFARHSYELKMATAFASPRLHLRSCRKRLPSAPRPSS